MSEREESKQIEKKVFILAQSQLSTESIEQGFN